MSTFHPYLNFDGKAEEAFIFYRSIFGGEFKMLQKFRDAPGGENLPEDEQNRVLHVALPLNDTTILVASDSFPSAGHVLKPGNNVYINVMADSREEADRLFNALSDGGTIEMPMEDTFWGDYFGSFRDKFDIQWMINYGAYK